ncbi:putative casparian strip membrane protein [Rosa chinensis]|uniref:CASP-like protein n=1 Tax=Rosa chinensis TaxID=74649 RepID=A0A2P6P4P3_ROSCH|nr:CASP-like protein 1F2 [Rosa chinensis]PRQ16889.1 putative casparian strip membrane protein [Rosa chinensis]
MATIEAKALQPNPPVRTQKLFLGAQICLRTVAMATTLAATWIMITSKQSTEIVGIAFDARYSYSSAFKFLAFANAVVSACCLVSLLLVFLLHLQGSNPNHYFLLFLHDLFIMCLVLAGCAAATAIGFVGRYGNSHTGWTPICDHFGKFCHRVLISVILSYLSLIILLMLTVSSAIKSRQIPVV